MINKEIENFRCIINTNGDRFWYDENNVLRKVICYFPNGNKTFEAYRNEKGELHCDDGFAFQTFDENGNVKVQLNFKDGKLLSHISEPAKGWSDEGMTRVRKQLQKEIDELKEEIAKLKSVETIEPDYLNPESPYYYKGYRYEKDEYNDEYWYDEDGTVRKEILTWKNGNKAFEYYYNEKGCYHSEDGYAIMEWGENGEVEEQLYYLNGVKLTEKEWLENKY